MSCLIKNIPNTAKVLYGTGNKGLFFPLVPVCETVAQPEAPPPEECYLAVELGNLTTSQTHPCHGTYERIWNWESHECGHSSDVVTWENTNNNQVLAKQWIDCFQEYDLIWSWGSRKCSAPIQTKWKDTKCTASYAKPWKPKQLACFEKHNLEWQWKARECGSNSTTQVKWKEAECSGLYAKKWKYEAPEPVEELTEDEILLERMNPVPSNDYRIQAPCIEVDFCYIALEEDGVTSIDQQENIDPFLTDCLYSL